ncbi:MAG: PQQ-dependent sugar dehydrogenase [Bacteroidota bacterium]
MTNFLKYPANKFIILFLIFVFTNQLFSQVFPTGFSQVRYLAIEDASAMALAPDGRVFICQKNGTVSIAKNGVLLPTPFLTLAVDQNGERGISGITFDPDFKTNNHLYIYYTAVTPTIHNRLSRFTANGDEALAGSEVPLLDAEPLKAVFHNGGGLAFGPDEKLYLAMGEDNEPNYSQNPAIYKGKLLRLNKDGSAPADNPFINSPSEVTKKIWCKGLRNPYTLSFQPGTGKLFVNNVGSDFWEEIHDGTLPDKNFGWPAVEGNSNDPAYDNPVYAYPHESTVQKGCAVVGGTFFNPTSTNYPAEYIGKYFYMDYCNGWMNYLTLDPNVTSTAFSSGMGTKNFALQVWPDGNLYYISRDNARSGIYKIIYSNINAPTITAQPTDKIITHGQATNFIVSASGLQPLNYQWKKNGVDIPGANASTYTIHYVEPSHAGEYSVKVSNGHGNAMSNIATLTVTPYNAAPVANIVTPVAVTYYKAGDIINFSGDASDAEDGTLPESAFEWIVEFHHNNDHFHPGVSIPAEIKGGSFTIPAIGEISAIVFYRLKLRVTDSNGLSDTVHVDILPTTSTITLNSQPNGLNLILDGQPHKTPYSVLVVSGMQRNIEIISPQKINDTIYVFDKWMHGGNPSQGFIASESNKTYTAVYKAYETKITPASSTTFCSGSVKLQANTGYGLSYQWEKNNVSIQGETNSTYTATTSGDYQVKVFSGNIMSWSAPTQVRITTALTARITPTGPTRFCSGKNIKLYANTCSGFAYQWRKNNMDIPGATDSIYEATSTGNYQIRIAQGAALAWSAEIAVTVDSCDDGTFVSVTEHPVPPPTKVDNFKMNVFPNPSTGMFTLDVCMEDAEEENMNVKVLNYLGQPVYDNQAQRINGCIRKTIELNGSLSTGVYILQLTVGKRVENTRILLTK